MKPDRFPFFPLFVDDFVGGTTSMTPEEVGAYIRLLIYQWSNGSIPEDRDRQSRVCGCQLTDYVLSKFVATPDGKLQNAKLESVRAGVIKLNENKSKAGKAGAMARWQTHSRRIADACDSQCDRNAEAMAEGMAERWQPKPKPNPKTEESVCVPPSGFPTSATEATKSCPTAGIPADFAETTWNQAAARGWRDSRDVPIRSWSHHLTSCWKYHRDRQAQEKANGSARRAIPEDRSITENLPLPRITICPTPKP